MSDQKKRKYKKNREGWGTLRQLPSGRFQAGYLGPDGVQYYAKDTFSTRTDAREWKSAVRASIQAGTWKSPSQLNAERFGPYARAWVAQRVNSRGEPLRERTKADYLSYIDRGLAVFADDPLRLITPERVRTWHAERLKVGKTQAAREARLLRAVLNTAIEDEHLTKNPVSGKLTLSTAGKKYRPPTEDELTAILDYFEEAAPQLRLAVLIAAHGGLRISEWRALRRTDLTVEDGRYVIEVAREAYRTRRLDRTAPKAARGEAKWTIVAPKSPEGLRKVTLPRWATNDVAVHLNTYVGKFPESLLFAPTGKTLFIDDKVFYRPWDTVREQLGIKGKVREHDLRGFAGTYHARISGSIKETMAFLGHSTTRAAMAYQHNIGDRAGEIADRMPAPKESPKQLISMETKRKAKNG